MKTLWCPTEAIIWLESTSYSTNFPAALSNGSMPNLEEKCLFHFTHLQFELEALIPFNKPSPSLTFERRVKTINVE